jgi:hypothetical protein
LLLRRIRCPLRHQVPARFSFVLLLLNTTFRCLRYLHMYV